MFCSNSMRLIIILHRFIWARAGVRSHIHSKPLGDRIFNNKIWLTQSAKTTTIKKAWSSHFDPQGNKNVFFRDVNNARQIYCDRFNFKEALHINIVTIIIWFWFTHWWHSNEHLLWLKAIWNHKITLKQQQKHWMNEFSFANTDLILIACSFLETAKNPTKRIIV